MKKLWVIRCDQPSELQPHPRDALFGDEPILYTTKRRADRRRRKLQTTGNWGRYLPPTYEILSVVEEADLTGEEQQDFLDGKIG